MKYLFIILTFLVAYLAPTPLTGQAEINQNGQVFIKNQTDGLPGKCYSKMMLNENTVWTEILCPAEISKKLIRQIQTDLIRLKFPLDTEELSKSKLGATTKKAIKDFQKANGLAYGNLDWGTINSLKGTK